MSKPYGKPQSRNEAILQNMLGENNDLLPPMSRIETLLLLLLEKLGTEESDTDAGAVTKELAPNTVVHFTGAVTSLTITLEDAEGHYHFDFVSGVTPTTLNLPATVTMPDDFTVEANKRYEIDILDGYGTVQSWSVS